MKNHYVGFQTDPILSKYDRECVRKTSFENAAQRTSQRVKCTSGARLTITVDRLIARAVARSIIARSLDSSVARTIGRPIAWSLGRSVALSFGRPFARSLARSIA